jgi:hypothetical protein
MVKTVCVVLAGYHEEESEEDYDVLHAWHFPGTKTVNYRFEWGFKFSRETGHRFSPVMSGTITNYGAQTIEEWAERSFYIL